MQKMETHGRYANKYETKEKTRSMYKHKKGTSKLFNVKNDTNNINTHRKYASLSKHINYSQTNTIYSNEFNNKYKQPPNSNPTSNETRKQLHGQLNNGRITTHTIKSRERTEQILKGYLTYQTYMNIPWIGGLVGGWMFWGFSFVGGVFCFFSHGTDFAITKQRKSLQITSLQKH